MEKDFTGMPCSKCNTIMYGGWVENPMYRVDGEIMIEMNIGYCPKCNTVENYIIKVSE